MYLKCPECGKDEFVEWHKLRESQAGGVVKEAGGSRCVGCNKHTDIGRALRTADLIRRKAELETLTQEMQGNEKSPKGGGVSPEPPRFKGEPTVV